MLCQTCPANRESTIYRICDGCAQWLWNAVIGLEEMNAALLTATALQPVYVPQEPDPGQPKVKNAIPVRSSKPQSKSPARDEAIMLTDLRSKSEKGHPISIPGVLRDWSGRIEDLTGERPAFGITGWSEHVRRCWNYGLTQAWITEVMKNVRSVHRRAQVLLEEAEPEQKPVGRCEEPACRGKLWLDDYLVVCAECGSCVDGYELVRAYDPAERPTDPMMTTTEMASYFDTKPGTVRQWMNRANIERDRQGKVDVRRITEYLSGRPIPRVA